MIRHESRRLSARAIGAAVLAVVAMLTALFVATPTASAQERSTASSRSVPIVPAVPCSLSVTADQTVVELGNTVDVQVAMRCDECPAPVVECRFTPTRLIAITSPGSTQEFGAPLPTTVAVRPFLMGITNFTAVVLGDLSYELADGTSGSYNAVFADAVAFTVIPEQTGDVNCDGVADALDAIAIWIYVGNPAQLPQSVRCKTAGTFDFGVGDVNRDGVVDATDAFVIADSSDPLEF